MDNRNYYVTIKGLVRDREDRVLFLREAINAWDLPGGRLEHGETFRECFARECREEIGVAGRLLDNRPEYTWTGQDAKGQWRLVLCFQAGLGSFNLKQSDECIGYDFFGKNDLKHINLRPQTRKILDYL